jgi:hypothetical protein
MNGVCCSNKASGGILPIIARIIPGKGTRKFCELVQTNVQSHEPLTLCNTGMPNKLEWNLESHKARRGLGYGDWNG